MDTSTSTDARARLGEVVRAAADGAVTRITAHRADAGAIVPLSAVQRLGLDVAGAWTLRAARRDWPDVRAAAEQAPQSITTRAAMAVLLGAAHTRLLDTGLAPLPARELVWDGQVLADEHGTPVPPGVYAVGGGVLRVGP